MGNARIESVKVIRQIDNDPDLSYLGEYSNKPAAVHIDRQARGDMGRNEYRYFNLGCGDADYIEDDYKRMEAYNRGSWFMLGIQAEAEVIVGDTVQCIQSGGLWGIESDSDKNYFEDVAAEELSQLATICEDLGCSKEELEKIPQRVEASSMKDR